MNNSQDYSNIILYDKNHNILMQKRWANAKIYPNHWGLFGGKIEQGETPDEAIYREIQEELNYFLQEYNFEFELPYEITGLQKGTWFIYSQYMREKEKEKLTLQEGEAMAWWSFEEVFSKLLINKEMREMLKKTQTIIQTKK